MKQVPKVGKLNIGLCFAWCRFLISKHIKQITRKPFIEYGIHAPLRAIKNCRKHPSN